MTHYPTPEHARLAEHGMYRPDLESDACGVGLVAATRRQAVAPVVEAAIEALKAVWHRGAVDADGKTGDGAGIHVDLPLRFFDDADRGVGPQGAARTASRSAWSSCRAPIWARRRTCRTIVEAEIIDAGFTIYGWRQVPVDVR